LRSLLVQLQLFEKVEATTQTEAAALFAGTQQNLQWHGCMRLFSSQPASSCRSNMQTSDILLQPLAITALPSWLLLLLLTAL
jgi:hypothetical protein